MNAAEQPGCFHCGLPLPKSGHCSVMVDQVAQPVCCPGCQAVAQTIIDSGLGDYYQNRSTWAANTGQQDLIPPQLSLVDNVADSSNGDSDKDSASEAKAEAEAMFAITGIRCAACVWLIEKHLRQIPGILRADINVATERLHVRWDKSRCKTSDILAAVRRIGYAAWPFDAVQHGEQLLRAEKTLFRQLFIAALLMMQAMMYSFPLYWAAGDGMDGMDEAMTAMMRWAGLILSVPAVMYCAQPFYRGAWQNLKNRLLGMDVPVVIAIAAAFFASMVATVRGVGEIYFDSIAMFIFLLLFSRYLELKTRRKAASALENLQRALPASAHWLQGFPASRESALVAVETLRVGDVILVKPGEAIAADGVIIEGETGIDVSLLSGESLPKQVGAGDAVPGGAVNVSQAVLLRVSAVAHQSTLSVMMRLVERATQAKPQLALWADRVAAWFVAGLLLFALGVFGVWHMIDPARAWPIAIAVLVVSCPCALSLATPTALAAGLNSLIKRGVLIVQPHVLETLQRSSHIIFDKTGTLTQGKPALTQIQRLGDAEQAVCLQLAAAMEAGNAHPLSAALIAAAASVETGAVGPGAVEKIRHVAGQGLEAWVGDVCYRLGSGGFVGELAGIADAADVAGIAGMSGMRGMTGMHGLSGMQGMAGMAGSSAVSAISSVYLGCPGQWLSRFDFCDPLRAEAQEVVAYFQAQGKQVILLSGDQQAIASQVAARLGIEEAHGDQLPEQKLAYVQTLQGAGAVVAMVGDGMNDAAMLAAADVSFAMGSGAALAQTHADAVLLSGRLWSLVESAEMAGKTMRIIRQNLAWATVYNLVAIPAAAFGLVGPLASGVGMTASSVLVVLNALRLRRGGRKAGNTASISATMAETATLSAPQSLADGSRLAQQQI